jgi:hypothetical protein
MLRTEIFKANRDDQVCERDKDIGKVFSVF